MAKKVIVPNEIYNKKGPAQRVDFRNIKMLV
jgi:hypothetical protein